MKAYAKPAIGAAPAPAPTSAATPLQHIAVGAAARLGAIACGLAWLFAALAAFAFDLFGINLWLTVLEARWVNTSGWESFPMLIAEFGGLVTGVAGAVLLGALLGALTAWLYNLTVAAPVQDFD